MPFARRVLADFSAQNRAIKQATSIADLYLRLEAAGCLLRIDRTVEPTMYRCAIVSPNSYLRPVPHPTNPIDWLTMSLAFNHNQLRWFDDPDLMHWLNRARLNAVSHMQSGDEDALAGAAAVIPRLMASNEKLAQLLSQG